MSEPYQGADDGYRGYPIHSDAAVRDFMPPRWRTTSRSSSTATATPRPSRCWTRMPPRLKKTGRAGIRPVMIHAQLLRADQLPQLAELGVIASFFVAHTWHWGDIHI